MRSSQQDVATQLDRDGFVILRDVAPVRLIEQLRTACEQIGDVRLQARRADSNYGIRHLLTGSPTLREIVSAEPFIEWAIAILGESARPVYGVFFDKTPGANWSVPWHQDVTIRVREARDVDGFSPRPVKDGSVHLIPPIELSQQLLAMRIHLDDATSTHGALRVIPASHLLRRLSNDEIERQVARNSSVSCDARSGDVMLMRPLLLHASSRCEQPGHRRIVHIEYAAFDLPGGLEWHG